MATQRFDDDWFMRRRDRLLRPWATPRTTVFRTVAALRAGSARSDRRTEEQEFFERALSRLAPRHAAAARAHAQFYCACLESLALVPADEMVRAALQIEWFWYTSPFKAFYRDHLAHVMKVALIAYDLAVTSDGPLAREDESALDWIAKGLATNALGTHALRQAARRAGCTAADLDSNDFWRDALLEALKTAALLHDLAYPSQMAAKLRHASAPADPFAVFAFPDESAVSRTLRLVDDTLVTTPFTRGELRPLDGGERVIAQSMLTRSHSFQAGAYILERRRESERTWRLAPREAFALEWAALAASLHDYDKAYEARPGSGKDAGADTALRAWLTADPRRPAVPPALENLAAVRPTFARDPASYLLALADQLQDFGRLNFERVQDASPEVVPLKLRYPWRAVTFSAQGDNATVVFELGSDDNTCFGCPGVSEREALVARKFADAAKIFGPGGWLDHSGLFASVETRCVG